MRVPKILKILGWEIKVKYKKKIVYNGDECFGLWVENESTIYLVTGLPSARKKEVLLHECIHAIEDITCLKLSHKIVNNLALGLGEVLSQIN